jgi:hypothetical protein
MAILLFMESRTMSSFNVSSTTNEAGIEYPLKTFDEVSSTNMPIFELPLEVDVPIPTLKSF